MNAPKSMRLLVTVTLLCFLLCSMCTHTHTHINALCLLCVRGMWCCVSQTKNVASFEFLNRNLSIDYYRLFDDNIGVVCRMIAKLQERLDTSSAYWIIFVHIIVVRNIVARIFRMDIEDISQTCLFRNFNLFD